MSFKREASRAVGVKHKHQFILIQEKIKPLKTSMISDPRKEYVLIMSSYNKIDDPDFVLVK